MLKKLSFSSSIKDRSECSNENENVSTNLSSRKFGPSKSHIHDCKLTEVSVISNSTTSPCTVSSRTKVQSSINGQRACNNSPVITRSGATVDTGSIKTETG